MLEVDPVEQHPSPRDDSTKSMFGDDTPSKPAKSYRVLARKYRPQLFSDLIGQEAMVRTLENAFRSGRIAHAFMLTGVRGVGKTTTARLLARGLNYLTDTVKQPSTVLDPMGQHCQAIMDSSHPDVLELDAASRTGVADMRDLLDGVRYSSVSARYKVYIIDEVHMLSIAAFNALLKTLEEPPEHVKFIFATTEIRKVPVTVLSRCQRFDLKRLDLDVLKNHLAQIATKEGASVEEEGLTLIARAAEGSVRDALSILDQAIVQGETGQQVSSESIRDMIGLGDRNRVLDVFEQMTQGDGGTAIKNIADQIVSGADPLVLVKDLLEICADIATAQAIGGTNIVGAESWVTRVNFLAQKLSSAQTALIWQMLLAGYQSAQLAPSTDTAVKMVILRIATSAKLPSPEQAAKMLASGGEPRKEVSPQVETSAPVKPAQQPVVNKETPDTLVQPSSENDIATRTQSENKPNFVKPLQEPVTVKEEPAQIIEPKTVDDVVMLMQKEKELGLSENFKQYIHIREFDVGKIVCSLKENAPDGLISKVSDFLNDKTSTSWGVETVKEVSPPVETSAPVKHVPQPVPHKETPEPLVQPSSPNDIATRTQSENKPNFVKPSQEPVTVKEELAQIIELKTVDEVVMLMQKEKELGLSGDFKQYIQIREFHVGKIVCSLKENAPDGLISKVSDFLNDKTSTSWSVKTVDIRDNNGETVKERDMRVKNEKIEIAKKDPNVMDLLGVLPDANIIDVES